MEQKEVLNDITHVTDHLYSSNLDADISKIKNAYDAKTNRGAETRACFENIGYEFACLFQAIETHRDAEDQHLDDKIQDKLSEAKFHVQVVF